MDLIYDEVTAFRAAYAVKRYHIMRMIRQQTVGEHSGHLALLVMQVEPNCSATLLKAALVHDLHERSTGDVPSTAKWAHPKLVEALNEAEVKFNDKFLINFPLTPAEQHLLKFCDYMELMLWCMEELNMGNQYAREGVDNIIRAINNLGTPNDRAYALFLMARNDYKTIK